MLFRLPIIKFFNRILNRITVTVVLVALQLAWLAWVFFSPFHNVGTAARYRLPVRSATSEKRTGSTPYAP